MREDEKARWRELRKALANDSEHRIRPCEKPTAPEAQVAAASLIGRIHLEWHIQERTKKDYWKWL